MVHFEGTPKAGAAVSAQVVRNLSAGSHASEITSNNTAILWVLSTSPHVADRIHQTINLNTIMRCCPNTVQYRNDAVSQSCCPPPPLPLISTDKPAQCDVSKMRGYGPAQKGAPNWVFVKDGYLISYVSGTG